MIYAQVLSISILAGLVAAVPVEFEVETCSSSITAQQIETISPASATCADAPKAGECRTASEAAQAFNQVFDTYNITTSGEKAAIISLEAFESGDFKYQNNYYPGNPGQGTRNMQSASYNLLYAKSIQALAENLTLITEGVEAASLSVTQVNAVRALLTSYDSYDFGSGAWFISQCSPDIRAGLQSGSMAGWTTYITSCVQTTVSIDRQAYYLRASATLDGGFA